MEALWKVEGVPPDRILPTSELKHSTTGGRSDDWWSFIPILWLYSRLKNSDLFKTEGDELAWWAERIYSLSVEFQSRAFEIAEKKDLDLEQAALEVCKQLSERPPDELMAFVIKSP